MSSIAQTTVPSADQSPTLVPSANPAPAVGQKRGRKVSVEERIQNAKRFNDLDKIDADIAKNLKQFQDELAELEREKQRWTDLQTKSATRRTQLTKPPAAPSPKTSPAVEETKEVLEAKLAELQAALSTTTVEVVRESIEKSIRNCNLKLKRFAPSKFMDMKADDLVAKYQDTLSKHSKAIRENRPTQVRSRFENALSDILKCMNARAIPVPEMEEDVSDAESCVSSAPSTEDIIDEMME